MKQIVLSGLFRRRNGDKKAAATDVDVANDGADVGRGMVRDSEARAAISSPPRRRTSAVGHRRRRLRDDDPAVVAPAQVIDLAEAQNDGAAATVSTLTNFGLEATMKTTERLLLPVQKDDNDDDGSRKSHDSLASFELAYSYDGGGGGIDDVGISHLSVRERMWYKNERYLLDKQRRNLCQESTTTPSMPPSAKGEDDVGAVARYQDGQHIRPASAVHGRLSSRYESADRGADRYSAGIDRHAVSSPDPNYSPKGVDEGSTAFESTNTYEGLNHCDSLMLPNKKTTRRPDRTTRRGRSPISEDDDNAGTYRAGSAVEVFEDNTCADTRTAQSSSLLNDGRTIRSSSLLGLSWIDDDDDSRESSFLFPDDEEGGGGECFLHDVSLQSGSSSMESGTLESGTMDESTLQETLDGTASVTPSYMFELVDNAGGQHGHRHRHRHHRRRRGEKYQVGVGKNAATHEWRKGVVETSTDPVHSRRTSSVSSSESTVPTSRRSVPSRLSHNTSADDTDVFAADAMTSCPFPEMVEEIVGTYADARLAFDQVLHAFFVSEDDVDAVADSLRDARVEFAEMYRDRFENGRIGQCGG